MAYEEETEAETVAKRIRPVLEVAGWGKVEGSKIKEQTICPGRILAGGKRGQQVHCDLVLEYKGRKLATIEAKKASISYSEGIAQTKDYAQRLGARFAYASNGLGWYQIDMVTAKEGDFQIPFPTPDELWTRTFEDDNAWRENFGAIPFEHGGGKWQTRYYQHRAITAALEAIAKGERRILLTLATGTGKTSIAFQIAWKLFQSKWNLSGEPTRRPRILFLADRNILADQASFAFSAFPSDAVARVSPGNIKTHASVFFTIFQTLMTGEKEKPAYMEYPEDFFDFIVIDECHRGGAKDESRWRDIMEHFEPAVQLGLTATPKRESNADTYAYFGEPVYTYALREGIADGYLTPFKVRQMASTIDEYVYTGEDFVQQGEVEIGDIFEEREFNRRIIIPERELSRVREFMGEMNQNEKTLVFCATQEHAAMVRDLINQVKSSDNVDYCHRVTAKDGKRGEQRLKDFQDNEMTIPTVLTTSRKLSTGVDARNVRNIVLMRPVGSMIEFKQIIGRGTRVYEDKNYFTIWDFVKACEMFKDPDWDGEPEEIIPPRGEKDGGDATHSINNLPTDPPLLREKVVIKLSDGKERRIQYLKTTNYVGPGGRFMSAVEFLEMLFGDLSGLVADEDRLRETWSNPETRRKFMEQLREREYTNEVLEEVKTLVDASGSDLFDVLGYVLFANPPITRKERVENLERNGLDDVDGEMREFLLRILASYAKSGEDELSAERLAQHVKAVYDNAIAGTDKLGGASVVRSAYLKMQERLYT